MDRRGLGAAVVDGDLDQKVLGRGLCVLDEDVEVAVVVEDPRVEQLVLEVEAGARNLSTRMRQQWFEFSESPRRRSAPALVG
jgi:hypothetical protein